MKNALVRGFGWRATLFHGDPTVLDRWIWLKANLVRGKKKTLDAGCGSGAFTLFAATVGNDATGISFNQHNMEKAQERSKILNLKNTKFIQGDLRQWPDFSTKIGNFDQILCFECIEHLIDDKSLIKNLSSALNEGGRLLLTTPFKGHHPVLGEPTDPNFQSSIEDGGHVRFGYTEAELKTLIESCGLKIEKTEFVSGYISQMLYNLWCRLDSRLPHKLTWAMILPLRLLQVLDRPISFLLKYPKLSLAVVARKPIRRETIQAA